MVSKMVTLTDKQALAMMSDLERLMKSAKNNRYYNTLRKHLLTFKKKIRYELLHKRKDL